MPEGPITPDELYAMFGEKLPSAVMQILQCADDDRTPDEVRSELRSLALMIKAADKT